MTALGSVLLKRVCGIHVRIFGTPKLIETGLGETIHDFCEADFCPELLPDSVSVVSKPIVDEVSFSARLLTRNYPETGLLENWPD